MKKNISGYLIYRSIGFGTDIPVGADQPVRRSIGRNDRLIRMGERHFAGFEYRGLNNLGDYIQSVAVERLLPVIEQRFDRVSLYLFCLLMLVFSCCQENKVKENGLITVDVTKKFPNKDLSLQDFVDIEYIPLETNNEFLCGGSKYLIAKNRNSDGNIYVFDRKGKGISTFNRKGNSGEEYLYLGNVLLDEEKEEIFISSVKKILVYDLYGNFRRSFPYKKGVEYYYQLTNYDKEHIICWDGSGESNPKAVESPSFYILSKSDGSIIKEINVPLNKRTSTLIILSRDEKTHMTYSLANTPNPIHKFRDRILLNEPSSDTIYRYSDEKGLIPYMCRIPSIHSMNPEIFLYTDIITDKYDFMRTYEKARNGEEKDLVYDKQQKTVYHCTLHNKDYKYQKYLRLKGKNINDEIASVESLDAFDLVNAYKKGYLQGELKEIASKMTEEDNAVIMLMKHKK